MNSKNFYESVSSLICLVVFLHGFGLIPQSHGQENTTIIQGSVKNIDNEPLPGATLVLVGTQLGTVTDFDGNYRLEIKTETLTAYGGVYNTLEASYVGYQKQHLEIGTKNILNFRLEFDNQLSETIVTGQGITREVRSLGYGVSVLKEEDIKDRPYTDLAQALNGKIPGVRIVTQSGRSGEESRIEIRTQLSIEDSRDPLLVLDNVPYSGSISDINIDDVKQITVLRGLSATTLYGNRGRNGVILIETKSASGEGELGVVFRVNQRYYTNRVGALPEYQNTYGPGNSFDFEQDESFSFGPAFADLDEIPHPLSRYYSDVFPEFADVTVPYEAKPDNVSKMFNDGFGSNTTISASAATEKSYLSTSLGYANEGGILGRNHLERFNFSIHGKIQISDKLNVRPNLFYSNSRVLDNLGNIAREIINLPRNIDLTEFPYEHPKEGTSVNYDQKDNPLWLIHNTKSVRQRSNFSLNFETDYQINKDLQLTYRGRYYQSTSFSKNDANRSGVRTSAYTTGRTSTTTGRNQSFDQTLLLVLNKVDLINNIGVDAQFGINSAQNKSESVGITSRGQLVRDYFNPEAFLTQSASYSKSRDNFAGAFLQSTLSYKNYMYLTLSGRNEWGSTVEKEHRSIFYPSVSMSLIPSSIFDMQGSALSFLKLRANYASTTAFPRSYQTRPYLTLDADRVDADDNTISILSLNNNFDNRDLKPELHREFEVGIESFLWNNRVKLDVSVFKRNSFDLIQRVSTTLATGYSSATVNLARVDGQGVELSLNTHLIKSPEFNYTMINVFSSSGTELKESHPLAANANLIVGESLSNIYGTYDLRDDEGNFLIDPNGRILTSNGAVDSDLPGRKVIGERNEKWSLSSIQQVNYKQFSLETQIEYSHGGDQITGFLYNGLLKNSLDRLGGYVINGVLGDNRTGLPILDANGNTIPNTRVQSALSAYRSGVSNESLLWDRSHFRIREILLHYNFTSKQLKKLKLDNLRISFSATNVWFRAINFPKYVNFDPNNSGGDGDLDVPLNKRFSLSISTSF